MSAPINCCCRWPIPEQILGLSRFSRDGWQSSQAERRSRFPMLSGGAEDVLMLKPDIVVASLFDKRSTRELSESQGAASRRIRGAANPRRGEAQIRRMGDIVRHTGSRGGGNREGSMPRWRGPAGRSRTGIIRVLPLSRRGWVPGSDSLVGSLLGEAGLCQRGRRSRRLLRRICLARSDRQARSPTSSLVSEAGDYAEDDGRAFLLHPALRALLSAGKSAS